MTIVWPKFHSTIRNIQIIQKNRPSRDKDFESSNLVDMYNLSVTSKPAL